MRRGLTALVAVCVLAVAAVAVAKPAPPKAGAYVGKTEVERPVNFKLQGGKIKNFVAGANLFCIGQGIRFDAAIPPVMTLRGKTFSFNGEDKNGAHLEISGKFVSATRVTGVVSMTDSGCSGEAKYSAKRK